jgi:myo-inositol-1(or 4)-monophosphatase
MRGDRAVAGVVRNPAADLEYVALLGGGATCNGAPVRVRTAPPLDQALIGTGFGYETQARARQARAASRMLPQVRDIRRQGSCALDLCAVAAGLLDGYVEEGPHLWDHAAGALVATEAGARVEIWPTAAGMDLVVAAPEAGWAGFSTLVGDCGYLDDSLMI